MTSAVILAAGEGRRLGGAAKALLRLPSGETFLARILATARAVGLGEAIVVVGGSFESEVAAHARALGARTCTNPNAAAGGMSSSIARGFAVLAELRGIEAARDRVGDAATAGTRGAAARADVSGAGATDAILDDAWLWPVDHPAVRVETLRALVAARGAHVVAQPRFADRGGHPPLVARAIWARLAACASLPGGARDVLRACDLVAVHVDDPGVVRDVDTPDDREAAQ